jgi:hypothetical protein
MLHAVTLQAMSLKRNHHPTRHELCHPLLNGLQAMSLKRNQHLRELFIYNTDLRYGGMKHLTAALEGNLMLSSINLGENTMDGPTVKLLVGLLKKSPAINQLYLDWGVRCSPSHHGFRCQPWILPFNQLRLDSAIQPAVPGF